MPGSIESHIIRFGSFEVDLRTGELRRNGVAVKLQGQPFQILAMLLEHPGELVTREDIRRRLWADDTFVDFEHSLNAAVKRLREALGEDAATTRFVETVPRRGYRFITPVVVGSKSAVNREKRSASWTRFIYLVPTLIGVVLLTGAVTRWTVWLSQSAKETQETAKIQNPPPAPLHNERVQAGVPEGTYLDSCREELRQGDILIAICQKLDGNWQPTTLAGIGQCSGDIWNVDGYLSCDLHSSTELPDPDLDPTRYYTHLSQAEKFEQNGAYEAAVLEYKQALKVSPPIHARCDRLWLAHAYAGSGDRTTATKVINDVIADFSQRTSSYCVAQAYVKIDKKEALKWLERAYREKDPRIHFLQADWRLANLRSDARFQQIARSSGRTK